MNRPACLRWVAGWRVDDRMVAVCRMPDSRIAVTKRIILLLILLLISWLDTIWLWFIVSSLLMFLSLTRMPPTCKPEDPVITINIFSYRQKEAPDPIALADPMR